MSTDFPIKPTSLVLIEDDWRFRVCSECDEEIPDPYLVADNQEVICSTCYYYLAEQRRQARLAVEFERPDLPPVRCVCGYELSECNVATCLPVRKPALGQKSLFEVPASMVKHR